MVEFRDTTLTLLRNKATFTRSSHAKKRAAPSFVPHFRYSSLLHYLTASNRKRSVHGDCGSAISQAQALLLSAKTTNGPTGGGRAGKFPHTPSLTQRHLAIFASFSSSFKYRKGELITIFSIVGGRNFICCRVMGYDGVTAAAKRELRVPCPRRTSARIRTIPRGNGRVVISCRAEGT